MGCICYKEYSNSGDIETMIPPDIDHKQNQI